MLDVSTPRERNFAPGMGRAVADRTVARLVEKPYGEIVFHEFQLPRDDSTALDDQVAAYAKEQGLLYSSYHIKSGDNLTVEGTLYVTGQLVREDWVDVATRVAIGNCSLHPDSFAKELPEFVDHLSRATTLMSGRHLQHGDENQRARPMEVFTNCATAPLTFLSFYLLLNGSGVGRDYSDDSVAVDLTKMPVVVPIIDWAHPDVGKGLAAGYMTEEEARHLYADSDIHVFKVPDSREGWAEGVAYMEWMAWQGMSSSVLLLDFSGVRENGAPIKGMQKRPASGPGPLMSAITNISRLRGAKMAPWRAALYADHYLAEVVLVGGARRAARMSTKFWRDPGIFEFIRVKAGGKFLWSSNNSVTVDQEFWDMVAKVESRKRENIDNFTDMEMHAWNVFNAVTLASYGDGTGEPGFINVDKFHARTEGTGFGHVLEGRLDLNRGMKDMIEKAVSLAFASPYPMITNPCGEIQLAKWGGYCVIADLVPYHARNLEDACQAARATTRALIRTNLMESLYNQEVKRTNRIGVGPTGIHEYALAHFGYGFRDLIDERKSRDFWEAMTQISRSVKTEAARYAKELGVTVPHTDTTIKPAGTTSKLFGLSEGAHLPSMREYIRWTMFREGDPLIDEYRDRGYPVKSLRTYKGSVIVGFPTKPKIIEIAEQLGLEDKVVTAAEATPLEQFTFLRLLEKYWIAGGLEEDTGNQVSYTLKYNPEKVDYEGFREIMLLNMPFVKCVSVMPQVDMSAYEYQPEQPVTKAEFEHIAAAIKAETTKDSSESLDMDHLACAGGACPVSFEKDGI